MAKSSDKTNAMRILEQKKISYSLHTYGDTGAVSGTEVANALGEDPKRVFKTLVTVGVSGKNYVFIVPVEDELDLKKAAREAGEKRVDMIKSKELLPLTGYIHGGCSPVGMKKQFDTFLHETAKKYDTVFVSGGRIGIQVELSPEGLRADVPFCYADLVKTDG